MKRDVVSMLARPVSNSKAAWAAAAMLTAFLPVANAQVISQFYQDGHAMPTTTTSTSWDGSTRQRVVDWPHYIGTGNGLVLVSTLSWDFGPVDARTIAASCNGTCNAPSLMRLVGNQVIYTSTTMTFSVDRHTSFALRGLMSNGADGSSSASVTLQGLTGTLAGACVGSNGRIQRTVSANDVPVSFNVACYGLLTPGTYQLDASGRLGFESLESRLTFTLCHADVNGQDGVTVQDIFDFLAGWFGGNVIVGNFNGDCCITVQDIFDFLTAWFQGC